MPLMLLIPVLMFLLFGVNSVLSIAVDPEVSSALGFTFHFLFSWGLLPSDDGSTFASLYGLLNLSKIAFWVLICILLIWQWKLRSKKMQQKESLSSQ